MCLVILTLLLMPIGAHAEPVSAAIVAWYTAATVVEVAIVAAQVALTVGSAIYGAAQQRKMARQQRDAYNAGLQDRTVTRVAADVPQVYVYGQARVGSLIVAMFTSGDKDQYKHLVCLHAAHESESIDEIYIAGKALGPLDEHGQVTDGPYAKTRTEHFGDVFYGSSFVLPHAPVADSLSIVFVDEERQHQSVPYTLTGQTVTLLEERPHVTVAYQYTIAEPMVRVRKHLGGPADPADSTLLAELDGAWPATAVLRGYTYTVIQLNMYQPEFQSGIPTIEVVMKGKKLYDPRTGVTAWNDNPVLAIRDYLTSEMCGVDAGDLPEAQMIAAANVCDEPQSFGKRYTLNGTVSADQPQARVLEKMAQAMAGSIVSTTWDITAGKWIAPVMALQQSDIIGSLVITPGVSDADLFNGVRGQSIDVGNMYVATDFKPYSNASFVAADGQELWTNIDFPFTNSLQRVHNLARIFVEDQRNGYTVKAEFSLKAWPVRVGQRVTLTSPFFGWNGKVFRVTDRRFSPSQAVELTLKEDAESIWDFADEVAVDATPNSDLPDPFAIAPLAGITCESGFDTLLMLQDGTAIPRIRVSWAPATTQAVQTNGAIEVEWKDAVSDVWQKAIVTGDATEAYLGPVTHATVYAVRARAVNPYLNVKSDWVYATHAAVGKDFPPEDVTGFAVTVLASGMRSFTFNSAGQPPEVLSGGGFLIRYRVAGSGLPWASMTDLHTGVLKSSPYQTVNPPAGTYDFAIAAKDSAGNVSAPVFVTGVAIADTLDTLLENAANAAAFASAAAAAATSAIDTIADDSILSKGEKTSIIEKVSVINAEYSAIHDKANFFNLLASSEKSAYDAARNALNLYLGSQFPYWNKVDENTILTAEPPMTGGATFRKKFTDLYTARQLLLNQMYLTASSGSFIIEKAIQSLMIDANQVSKASSAAYQYQREVSSSGATELLAIPLTVSGLQDLHIWMSCVVVGAHRGTASNYDSFFESDYWKFNALSAPMDFFFVLKTGSIDTYQSASQEDVPVPPSTSAMASIMGKIPLATQNILPGNYTLSVRARVDDGYEKCAVRQLNVAIIEVKR